MTALATEILEDDLVEALAPEGVPIADDGRWRIESPDQADWAVRRVAQARRRAADIERLASREIERITAWAEAQTQKLDRDETYFLGLLEEWHRSRADEDGKTVALPAGKLRLRKSPDRIEVEDEDGFVAWVESADHDALDGVLRWQPQILKSAIKDYMVRTGEIPPHVRIVTGLERFSVDVK